ncbi:Uncharacterised protein [Enterobacter cloacae]|nr:Uncharacterised protein [Enterobacter cloacae]
MPVKLLTRQRAMIEGQYVLIEIAGATGLWGSTANAAWQYVVSCIFLIDHGAACPHVDAWRIKKTDTLFKIDGTVMVSRTTVGQRKYFF